MKMKMMMMMTKTEGWSLNKPLRRLMVRHHQLALVARRK